MSEKKDTLERYMPQGRKVEIRDNIFLDRMDGYQFQQFIASLFQRLGFSNVKVGPRGADEGIDVKMEQATDLGTIRYVVECKHHAEGIIGRPTIQKLHSAIITKAMNKGIIVTSGYFSSDAIQYAESVGIELVDIDKLKELAKKAGLSVHEESRSLIDNCFPISDETAIVESLRDFLKNDLIGFQKDMVKVEDVSLRLPSAYMIDYAVNARFSTSVGIIHAIHTSSSAFFDGDNGRLLNPEITAPFVAMTGKLSEVHENQITARLVEKGEFAKSFREIKENAKEALAKLHTRTVSYYGKNNVRYTKTCIPHKKDIAIRDVRRVYLPIWSIRFSILKNKYIINTTETSGTLNVLPSSSIVVQGTPNTKVYPDHCMICYDDLEKEAYLCSECGAIVCRKDRFECKVCSKVVCRNDVVTKRKYLIFKDRYCTECAKSQGIHGKTAGIVV